MDPTAGQRSRGDTDLHLESSLIPGPAVVRQADLDVAQEDPVPWFSPWGQFQDGPEPHSK